MNSHFHKVHYSLNLGSFINCKTRSLVKVIDKKPLARVESFIWNTQYCARNVGFRFYRNFDIHTYTYLCDGSLLLENDHKLSFMSGKPTLSHYIFEN